jgi:hypothetical protein
VGKARKEYIDVTEEIKERKEKKQYIYIYICVCVCGQSSWLQNGDVCIMLPARYELNLYMLCRRK